MRSEAKGAIIFGIVLLVVGLVAYSYQMMYHSSYLGADIPSGHYPYQTAGIILIVVGAVFVGLGLFYPSPKTINLPTPK